MIHRRAHRLRALVLMTIIVIRKGKDPSGGVWRNPCTDFLCSFSLTKRGHVEHVPFSHSELYQHVCKEHMLLLREAHVRLSFLLGLLKEGASVSHSHQNSRFSQEKILPVGKITLSL